MQKYAEPIDVRQVAPAHLHLRFRREDRQNCPDVLHISRTRTNSQTTRTMASMRGLALLPQCTACVRRATLQNSEAWGTQQIRSISKKAKEAERNIVVKLLKDVPRFGRAGTIYGMECALQELDMSLLQSHCCSVKHAPRNHKLQHWLTLQRLLCPPQPLADAQSLVSRTHCRLCSRYAVEAAQGSGRGFGTRRHIWRKAESGGGR